MYLEKISGAVLYCTDYYLGCSSIQKSQLGGEFRPVRHQMNTHSQDCPIPGRQARLPSYASNWALLETHPDSAAFADCSCWFTPLDWNMRITSAHPWWNAGLASRLKDGTQSLMISYKTYLHPPGSKYLTGSSISVYHKKKN